MSATRTAFDPSGSRRTLNEQGSFPRMAGFGVSTTESLRLRLASGASRSGGYIPSRTPASRLSRVFDESTAPSSALSAASDPKTLHATARVGALPTAKMTSKDLVFPIPLLSRFPTRRQPVSRPRLNSRARIALRTCSKTKKRPDLAARTLRRVAREADLRAGSLPGACSRLRA